MGRKAEVVYAVESVEGAPESNTATATSLVYWPIAVRAVSSPICWRFHWYTQLGSCVKFIALAFKSNSKLSFGYNSL